MAIIWHHRGYVVQLLLLALLLWAHYGAVMAQSDESESTLQCLFSIITQIYGLKSKYNVLVIPALALRCIFFPFQVQR